MKYTKEDIYYFMEMAFLAGRWRGQADLEEDMDNNFFNAFLQYSQTQKDMGVNHSVALPNTFIDVKDKKGNWTYKSVPDINGKYVRYKLRSDKWREGVKKTTKKDFDEIIDKLINYLNTKTR